MRSRRRHARRRSSFLSTRKALPKTEPEPGLGVGGYRNLGGFANHWSVAPPRRLEEGSRGRPR
jgi:hypothetical protein